MRLCKRCNTTRPISEFYKDKHCPIGIQYYCKSCSDLLNTNYKRRSKWYSSETARRLYRGYAARHRENIARLQQKYRKEFPNKHYARTAVSVAVKKGKLVRGKCRDCDATKTEGHHHKGYDKENYLSVVWLCKRHHSDEHIKLKNKQIKL